MSWSSSLESAIGEPQFTSLDEAHIGSFGKTSYGIGDGIVELVACDDVPTVYLTPLYQFLSELHATTAAQSSV